MDIDKTRHDIVQHIKETWPGAKLDFFSWNRGRIVESIPHFRVCRVTPTSASMPWMYVSIGASEFLNAIGEHLEFVVMSPIESPEHVETLAMVSNRHIAPQFSMMMGRVVPIGRAWMDGSKCDHLLVGLPYAIGSGFEYSSSQGHEIRFLWLIPITRKETDFVRQFGQEALEVEFEKQEVRVTDPFRNEIVLRGQREGQR